MKDAFGGTFMIKVMLIFFVIFISFMAVAINYSKVFRVKNGVINILERNAISNSDELMSNIEDYLSSTGYVYPNNDKISKDCNEQVKEKYGDKTVAYMNLNGVCIIPFGTDSERYYKVSVYLVFDFPLFDIGTVVSVSGETKIIKNAVL